MNMTAETDAHAEKERRDGAFSSVVAAVFLTVLKLIVGLMTGSLGLAWLSERLGPEWAWLI
jgi:divalent metal cation (Fe/Co/Zn/Cd) transporter